MHSPSKLAELFTPIDLCPVKFSKLSNGINSNVYKVECNSGELYVLKLFPGTEQSLATRFLRELTVYECLQKYDISRTATLVYSSEASNYAIYSYIPG